MCEYYTVIKIYAIHYAVRFVSSAISSSLIDVRWIVPEKMREFEREVEEMLARGM